MECKYAHKKDDHEAEAKVEPKVSLEIPKVDGEDVDTATAKPRLVLVASGMDEEMEQYAEHIALDAIAKICNDKTEIAREILNRFEAKYGSRWHCIVGDGHIRFYIRYAAANHIYFAAGPFLVFLFRLLSNSPHTMVNRFHRKTSDSYIQTEVQQESTVLKTGMDPEMQHYAVKLANDAIKEFPNELIMISQYMTTKFELRYGDVWHCAVSNCQLGICVRHHPVDNTYFHVQKRHIFLFREEDSGQAGKSLCANSQRRISASHWRATKVIASGLDMDTQQFAVNLATQALAMNFENHENTQIAHVMVTRFEERFGMPWHCVVSDSNMGFYAVYDKHNYIYMQVEPIVIFLFQHKKAHKAVEGEQSAVKEKERTPEQEDGTGNAGEQNWDEEADEGGLAHANKPVVEVQGNGEDQIDELSVSVTACGFNDEMRCLAIKLGCEAVSRFSPKMQIAHYVMTRFETSFGAPWHCVVSDGSLGFFVRYAASSFILYSIDSTQIFLFRHNDSFDSH